MRRGSQFDQSAHARMIKRNESDRTNDRKMMAVEAKEREVSVSFACALWQRTHS